MENTNANANANTNNTTLQGKPYKICDAGRKVKKGVVASCLQELIEKLPEKLDNSSTENVTIVLENDGTEVDEEDYFATLDANTCLMALYGGEKWTSEIPQCHISLDQTDATILGRRRLPGLVGQLKHNLCHVSVLGGPDLELLSDMDPDSVADIIFPQDKEFLETLKEASGRLLCEKRQAHDAMELLNLYHKSVQGNGGTGGVPNEEGANQNAAQPELA